MVYFATLLHFKSDFIKLKNKQKVSGRFNIPIYMQKADKQKKWLAKPPGFFIRPIRTLEVFKLPVILLKKLRIEQLVQACQTNRVIHGTACEKVDRILKLHRFAFVNDFYIQ